MARTKELKSVTVTSKGYGKKLKGIEIYYEGKKPNGLKKDGSFQFGKHILEALVRKYGTKFRLILTEGTDSITEEYRIKRVRVSLKLLALMSRQLWDRNRDIKNDIVKSYLSSTFPTEFDTTSRAVYVPGTLAKILADDPSQRLSGEDKEAVQRFLPNFIASESIKSVNLLKAAAQIESLKELSADLKEAIDTTHAESWWQTFIKEKILVIQQGYIQAIEKMNITVGTMRFPDFSLVTHDGYIDILEIKRPDTALIKLDGRGNYRADNELGSSVIQVENYIENISSQKDAIRSHILDKYGLNLKVVRPRGIILAGNATKFISQKEKDDFRLLAHGLKNVTIVTYDELLTRLENYIKVLEETSKIGGSSDKLESAPKRKFKLRFKKTGKRSLPDASEVRD